MATAEEAYDAILRLGAFCKGAVATRLVEHACARIAASDRVARAAARARQCGDPVRICMPRRSKKRVLDELLACCRGASTAVVQQARDAERWLCPQQHAPAAQQQPCKRQRTTLWARAPPAPLPPRHVVVHSPFACDGSSALSVYVSSDARAQALCADVACAMLREAGYSKHFDAVPTPADMPNAQAVQDRLLEIARLAVHSAARLRSAVDDPFRCMRDFAPAAWTRSLSAARGRLGAQCGVPVVTAHRARAIRATLMRVMPADVTAIVMSMVDTDAQSPDLRAGTAFALVREMQAAGVSLAWPLPGHARLRRCLALCSVASQAFAGRLAARLNAEERLEGTIRWSDFSDGACGGDP